MIHTREHSMDFVPTSEYIQQQQQQQQSNISQHKK